jgi:phenylpropionate dioxygenase-like ring-hydroxylating dioxygenase large terminal subunit
MTTSGEPLDGCWYAVATSDAIGNDPSPIEVREVAYVLWRGPDGALIAAADRCTHREAKLSLGTVTDGCLQCPYHGWTFGDAGRCVSVPSSGPHAAIAPAAHLSPLSVVEQYGLVWFCPGEPTQSIPYLGVDDNSSFTRLNTSMEVWNCSVTRMIDNMLDVAHFPYTHAGTFGREQEQIVPKFTLEQLDDTFYGYAYSVTVNNEGEAKSMSGGGDDIIQLGMIRSPVLSAQHHVIRERNRTDPVHDRLPHQCSAELLHLRAVAQRRRIGIGAGHRRFRAAGRPRRPRDARTTLRRTVPRTRRTG